MTDTRSGSTGAKEPPGEKQRGRGPLRLLPTVGRRGLITALLALLWLGGLLILSQGPFNPFTAYFGRTYARQFPNRAVGDNYLVGAFFYPWYGPARHKWQDGYVHLPAFGEYSSDDQRIIDQQIDLATGHGIDFFLVSWWGPDSHEDQTLRTSFLTSPLIGDIKFAINYESEGRLVVHDGRIDLDDPRNRQMLAADFHYLAVTYWSNPQYLKIHGSNVVFLYSSKSFIGDVAGAMRDLRTRASKDGFSIYIIGDEVNWDGSSQMNPDRLRAFDAISSYSMYTTNPDSLNDFTAKVSSEYSLWEHAAASFGVTFVPDAIPGFDDTEVRPGAHHPPLPPNAARFQSQADLALAHVEPPLNMLLITSWNEWNEDTAIEPSQEYGSQYLEILQNELARLPVPTPTGARARPAAGSSGDRARVLAGRGGRLDPVDALRQW